MNRSSFGLDYEAKVHQIAYRFVALIGPSYHQLAHGLLTVYSIRPSTHQGASGGYVRLL